METEMAMEGTAKMEHRARKDPLGNFKRKY
jgi:hypothetical protein